MTNSKTIRDASAILLALFHEQDRQFFALHDAYQILKNSTAEAVRKLLSQMVERGLLMRIKDGVYHIIPYEKDTKTYMPDWHLTAMHLVENCEFYIGYYSALAVHNLITQPALKEQLVINKKVVKSVITVKDIDFQLIYHNNSHFFGVKSVWIDSFNKVRCSDIEKTFIDCLFKPEYGGGIVEIAKAIYKAKNSIDYTKLYEYAVKFDNQAVIKRLGYLLEKLGMENPVIEKLHKKRSSAFTLLDPSLPKEGKIQTRWNVQQNIEIETITAALEH